MNEASHSGTQAPTTLNQPPSPVPLQQKQPTMNIIANSGGQALRTLSDTLHGTSLPTLDDMTNGRVVDTVHDVVAQSKTFRILVWILLLGICAFFSCLVVKQVDVNILNPANYGRIIVFVWGIPSLVGLLVLAPACALPFSSTLS